ncbi:MAG: hypothetical protein ACLFN2_00470 [Bacteroidales bacterium]
MNTEKKEGKENQMNTLKTVLIIVAAVLVLSLVGNFIYISKSGRLSDEKAELTEIKEELEVENEVLEEANVVKDGIIEEKDTLIEEMEHAHDSIVSARDSRIAALSRRVSTTAEELEEQVELNNQLTAANEGLEGENEALRDQLAQMQDEMNALAETHQRLRGQAEEAKAMNIYSINVLTMWDRWLFADRYNVSRASRVDYTTIRFETDGTIFTEAGPKVIHMRMLNPEGDLMYASADEFTETDSGEAMSYTTMEEINYDHQPVEVQFTLVHEERLQPGNYTMEFYVDGELRRTREMVLE